MKTNFPVYSRSFKYVLSLVFMCILLMSAEIVTSRQTKNGYLSVSYDIIRSDDMSAQMAVATGEKERHISISTAETVPLYIATSDTELRSSVPLESTNAVK